MGEYLLTLPQQLEVLLGEEGSEGEEEGDEGRTGGRSANNGVATDDGEELAASWLDKVGTSLRIFCNLSFKFGMRLVGSWFNSMMI